MIRLLVAALLISLPAAALDPFEIQIYDGTANAAGAAGLELHLNYVARGLQSSGGPEPPPDHQTHITMEPSYGVTSFWELGGYLQGALRPDGTFDYAGAKLRSKLVTPPGWHDHLRLGFNLEVSRLPLSYDRARWGTELRPIIAWEDDRWIFAANPNFEMALAGPDVHEGPAFEPGVGNSTVGVRPNSPPQMTSVLSKRPRCLRSLRKAPMPRSHWPARRRWLTSISS